MTCIAKIKSKRYAPRSHEDYGTAALIGQRCPFEATHGRHCYTHARDYETRWAEMDARTGRVG